ncbi:MAG: hypothetical protein WA624_21795 [Methylocella sp.]
MTSLKRTHHVNQRPPFECIALILQGGGALGAYQAGVLLSVQPIAKTNFGVFLLNSGDYYYDVPRGGLLITDGAENWFDPFSVALPPG